jgi:hypothetical protein
VFVAVSAAVAAGGDDGGAPSVRAARAAACADAVASGHRFEDIELAFSAPDAGAAAAGAAGGGEILAAAATEAESMVSSPSSASAAAPSWPWPVWIWAGLLHSLHPRAFSSPLQVSGQLLCYPSGKETSVVRLIAGVWKRGLAQIKKEEPEEAMEV